MGRFLSIDPVGVSAATGANFNRYWYANNNPYRFVDPDGREPDCATQTCNLEASAAPQDRKGPKEENKANALSRRANLHTMTFAEVPSGGWTAAEIADSMSIAGELVGARIDDMFDLSISFGAQGGVDGKLGLFSLGFDLSLFALEWDGGLNYKGVSQGGGIRGGLNGVGELAFSKTRMGPGAPTGPFDTTFEVARFSRNSEGDFVVGAGLSLFIGISVEANVTKTIAPFRNE